MMQNHGGDEMIHYPTLRKFVDLRRIHPMGHTARTLLRSLHSGRIGSSISIKRVCFAFWLQTQRWDIGKHPPSASSLPR
jgi:hypothetical protein